MRIIPTSGGVHAALDFELTNKRILAGLAQAAVDGASARVFGVWDGLPGDGGGCTASFLSLARAANFDGQVLDLGQLRVAGNTTLMPIGTLATGRSASTEGDGYIGFVVATAGTAVQHVDSANSALAAVNASPADTQAYCIVGHFGCTTAPTPLEELSASCRRQLDADVAALAA